MEAHAEADACVDACAKLQADLERCLSDVSLQELAVAGREWELQEKEEESARKLERESSELQSHANDLSTHEATMEEEWGRLRKTREFLYTCELTITSQEGTLKHHAIALTVKEKELANKEKWLADAGLQELAITHKMVEDL
jgi:hypothetical protein